MNFIAVLPNNVVSRSDAIEPEGKMGLVEVSREGILLAIEADIRR